MKSVFILIAVFVFSISVISIQSCGKGGGSVKASILNASIQEGGGSIAMIKLSKSSDVPVTVNYISASGTATSGVDFPAVSGSVTFNPGETSKNVTITAFPDGVTESDETFTITITSTTVEIDEGTATITITDAPLTTTGTYLFGTVDGQVWSMLDGSNGGTSDRDASSLNWIYTGGLWVDFSTADVYGGVGVSGPYTGVSSNDFYNLISTGSKGMASSTNDFGGGVTFKDANGDMWYSGDGNQTGSTFEVTERSAKTSNGLHAYFAGDFSCKLYGPGGAVKTLTNGHFRSIVLLNL